MSSLPGKAGEGLKGRAGGIYSWREETAVSICRFVAGKGAVLLRAPPGSGKTALLQSIERVARRPPGRLGGFRETFYVSYAALAPKEDNNPSTWTEEDVWRKYYPDRSLKEILSPPFSPFPSPFPSPLSSPSPSPSPIPVTKSETSSKSEISSEDGLGLEQQAHNGPNLILVDDAHCGFGLPLLMWAVMKSTMSGMRPGVRIIIVSSWGGDDAGDGSGFAHTPCSWNKGDAVISLR